MSLHSDQSEKEIKILTTEKDEIEKSIALKSSVNSFFTARDETKSKEMAASKIIEYE